MARTVVLLVVERLEMSRRKAGRSWWVVEGEARAPSCTGVRSVAPSEVMDAFALVAGEGLDEAGAGWAMADDE